MGEDPSLFGKLHLTKMTAFFLHLQYTLKTSQQFFSKQSAPELAEPACTHRAKSFPREPAAMLPPAVVPAVHENRTICTLALFILRQPCTYASVCSAAYYLVSTGTWPTALFYTANGQQPFPLTALYKTSNEKIF